MGIFSLSRFALTMSAAAALLAGCGVLRQAQDDTQPPIGAPSVMPRGTGAAIRAGYEASWMLKEATSEPLLYITAPTYVDVVSFPQGKLVGRLSDIDGPSGVCADVKGDVFVTAVWTEDVLEFAHGGTSPIAKLGDYGYYPAGCSVDPTTGNLAVANFSSMDESGGNLAIYKDAQGKPTDYTGPGFDGFYWCAYDNAGNLLADNGGSYAEMLAGSSSLNPVNLDATGQGIQWDGSYFAIVNPSAKQIYRVSISGSNGRVVDTINFTGLIWSLGDDFVFSGNKVVLPYSIKQNAPLKVATARYPTGGRLGKSFKIGRDYYYAMALSN